jgi:hypothetical protein
MKRLEPSTGWVGPPASRPVVLVIQVGAAVGSRAAAAALACAASEPDRAALMIDVGEGRPPRPALISTVGARALEERLAAHLPDAPSASRGPLCRLALPADAVSIDRIAAALPLVRESAGVIHLPPGSLRPLLEDRRIRPTAALLRADLSADRALTALVARDLIERGLRVAVLKRPLGWLTARAALLGALPAGKGPPARPCKRLLSTEDKSLRNCYGGEGESKGDKEENQPERSEIASGRRRNEGRRRLRKGQDHA